MSLGLFVRILFVARPVCDDSISTHKLRGAFPPPFPMNSDKKETTTKVLRLVQPRVFAVQQPASLTPPPLPHYSHVGPPRSPPFLPPPPNPYSPLHSLLPTCRSALIPPSSLPLCPSGVIPPSSLPLCPSGLIPPPFSPPPSPLPLCPSAFTPLPPPPHTHTAHTHTTLRVWWALLSPAACLHL